MSTMKKLREEIEALTNHIDCCDDFMIPVEIRTAIEFAQDVLDCLTAMRDTQNPMNYEGTKGRVYRFIQGDCDNCLPDIVGCFKVLKHPDTLQEIADAINELVEEGHVKPIYHDVTVCHNDGSLYPFTSYEATENL